MKVVQMTNKRVRKEDKEITQQNYRDANTNDGVSIQNEVVVTGIDLGVALPVNKPAAAAAAAAAAG